MTFQLPTLKCHYIIVTLYCIVNAVSLGGGRVMNTREAKAVELADRGRVVADKGGWLVFSLNGPEKYTVTLEPPFCSCPDFETRHAACKHVLATKIFASRPWCDFRNQDKPQEAP